MRSLLWFILGVVSVWLIVALPAALLASDPTQRNATLLFSSLAFCICLVPSALTLVLSLLGLTRPQDQWMVVVGGTGIRMFVTLGVSVGLFIYFRAEETQGHPLQIPYFRQEEYQGQFWLWILAAYLTTLAIETMVVLRASPKTETPIAPTTPLAAGEVTNG